MKKPTLILVIFCLFVATLISIIAILVFSAFISIEEAQNNLFKTVLINNCQLKVEVADTPFKRSQGLSYRESLPADHGMLFVFEDYVNVGFWMKDMQFPLDIIWLQDDNIIDITENVPVPQENDPLKSYHASGPVNYVIEVNAGWVKENNIKLDDKIQVI